MGHHILGQPQQINVLEIHPGLPCLGARQRQQTVDQTRQTVHLFQHAADDRPVLPVIAMSAQAHFANAADGGQWRPQLVRHVGGKATHLLERRLQPSKGLVEHRRQLPHLVVWIGHGQAFAQAFGRYHAGALGDALHRRQRTLRQPEAPEPGNGHGRRQAKAARMSTSSFNCSRMGPSDRAT